MKKNQMMQEQLRQAYTHALPPSNVDALLLRCGKEAERGMIIMMQPKRNRAVRTAAAVAAAFMLIVGGGISVRAYQANFAVASTVSLDVNPSIEITVNEKERVLAVTPKNEDAVKVVGEMDFAGNSLEVTVNALIGSMLRGGYLDDIADAILVSVDSRNSEAGDALQNRLRETVSAILQEAAFEGQILIQKTDADQELVDKADENSISMGKTKLIEQILANTEIRYSFAELSRWSIGELNLLAEGKLDDAVAEKIVSAAGELFVPADGVKQAAIAASELEESLVENYTLTIAAKNGRIVYRICYDDIKFRFYVDVDALSGEASLVNRVAHIYRMENLSEERLTVLDYALAHAGLTRDDIIIRSMVPTIRSSVGLEDFYHICFYDKDKTTYYDYEVGRYSGEIFKGEGVKFTRVHHTLVNLVKNGHTVSENVITNEDMKNGTLEAIRLDCGLTKEQITIKNAVALKANLRPNTISYRIIFTTAEGEYKYICDVLKNYEIIDKTFTPAN